MGCFGFVSGFADGMVSSHAVRFSCFVWHGGDRSEVFWNVAELELLFFKMVFIVQNNYFAWCRCEGVLV
ncbi:unnamed protein product [Lathyrus sativus]|nr:unnamed protein product [Lathyrus sativus]